MNRRGVGFAVLCVLAVTSMSGQAEDIVPLTQGPQLVFEDPGIIRVAHGATCGEFSGDGFLGNLENLVEGFKENFPCCAFDGSVTIFEIPLTPYRSDEGMITMGDEWPLPEWANRATVIVNGWSLVYVDTDHHVSTMGATLLPEVSGRTVRWISAATLGDKGMDDQIKGCVYYTALAWNSAEIEASAVPVEPGLDNVAPMDHTSWSLYGIGGAEIRYKAEDPGLNGTEPVAVLPRGFVVSVDFKPDDDDHVFQVGHATSQNTTLSLTSVAGWKATGLLRDNGDPVVTFMSSPVTLLRGTGVEVIDNPFAIEDRQPTCPFWSWGGCIGPGPGDNPGAVHKEPLRETFRLRSEGGYLIPMLTGFDMAFATDDQHLRWAMAAIDEYSFDPASGILEYRVSTAMQDKNKKPGYRVQTDVDILVLRRSHGRGGLDDPGILERPVAGTGF